MKKLILFLALGVFGLANSQYYPNNGNNGWPDNGYYSDDDDRYYFPDDYYYEYPSDYYSDDYYESYYNDYRRSISMVNWDRFFYEYGLTPYQIEMIMDLNRQFSSYSVWNGYYRMNPNRWYYDRFFALERILGPRIFIVFQNRYYNGYSPVVYYTNHWRDYYRPRWRAAPMYRNVNINIYRIDRNVYHQQVGNQYGWNQPRNTNNPGGFREGNYTNPSNIGGERNQAVRRNEGMRSNVPSSRENSGMRSSVPRTEQNARTQAPRTAQQPRRENSGSRTAVPNMRSSGSSQGQRTAPQRTEGIKRNNSSENRSSGRNSGIRLTSTR